jgi:hypothetical protein
MGMASICIARARISRFVVPPRIDFDQGNYHCGYYDCTYAYHPLGHEPIVDPSPRFYVLAPNAKIISIPEGR